MDRRQFCIAATGVAATAAVAPKALAEKLWVRERVLQYQRQDECRPGKMTLQRIHMLLRNDGACAYVCSRIDRHHSLRRMNLEVSKLWMLDDPLQYPPATYESFNEGFAEQMARYDAVEVQPHELEAL